nr:MAG TPA: hypothetical protein [Caudoviricetes sp.]
MLIKFLISALRLLTSILMMRRRKIKIKMRSNYGIRIS